MASAAAAADAAAAPSRDAILARPLHHNPLWADVKPLKQDDGEADGAMPVVPIHYPAHYSDVMDMFRAVLASNELSARTLLLSEAVIDVNSANYSAWHFRRLCLDALRGDLAKELEWVATVALDTPKNYQLWHHRRLLLEKLADCSPLRALTELNLTADVLRQDSKNYHAWSHRQWCLHFFSRPSAREVQLAAAEEDGSPPLSPHADVYAAELVFIDTLLAADVRNNSAWNQRFFVRTHARTSGAAQEYPAAGSSLRQGAAMSAQIVQEELMYTGAKLLLAPHNESPWNYLEGLMRQENFDENHRRELMQILVHMPDYPAALAPLDAKTAGMTELEDRATLLPNRFAQSLLVEMWEQRGARERAAAACERLAGDLDPIRSKYWTFRKQQLEQKAQSAQSATSAGAGSGADAAASAS